MRRTYGLDDESAKDVSAEKREEVTREVFSLFDTDRNGLIEKEEWMVRIKEGRRLPDFGVRDYGHVEPNMRKIVTWRMWCLK